MINPTHAPPPDYALFNAWQQGDARAAQRLRKLFDAAIAGQFDDAFAAPVAPEHVTCTVSLHLLTLRVMHELYGMSSADFYKADPVRYVRTTLFTQRLLGIRKLTLGWPAYAFSAEALGQAMLYPEGHVPGTDPGEPLLSGRYLDDVPALDFSSSIPSIIDEMLLCFAELTGLEPVEHLSAPYSLAADILGQQTLLMMLMQQPDFVHVFLDTLVEQVFKPWIEHLTRLAPNCWIELSDASGSPMFIGPQRCISVAVPPVRSLTAHKDWGRRVFVANYRGDHLFASSSDARQRRSKSRTRRSQPSPQDSMQANAHELEALFAFKREICPEFVIKLAADQLPLPVYVEQAVQHGLPLYLGIGATAIDRQSRHGVTDVTQHLRHLATTYAQAIASVSQALAEQGKPRSQCAWPGDIYIEDINAESDFNLVQIIVETVAQSG